MTTPKTLPWLIALLFLTPSVRSETPPGKSGTNDAPPSPKTPPVGKENGKANAAPPAKDKTEVRKPLSKKLFQNETVDSPPRHRNANKPKDDSAMPFVDGRRRRVEGRTRSGGASGLPGKGVWPSSDPRYTGIIIKPDPGINYSMKISPDLTGSNIIERSAPGNDPYLPLDQILKDWIAKNRKKPAGAFLPEPPDEEMEKLIGRIYKAYEARIDGMNPPDLRPDVLEKLGAIPQDFESVWKDSVSKPVRDGETQSLPLLDVYRSTLEHSKIKIDRFADPLASLEFVRQLQVHLFEVNRAYWALYFARSSHLLDKQQVDDTARIVERLGKLADGDALESEVLRARSALATRRSFLNRSEMAISNSEERLRALVNDPDQPVGSDTEMLPTALPVLSPCREDVKTIARQALHNRPEIQQGFDQLRAAVFRVDMDEKEKKRTLDLLADLMLADIPGAAEDQRDLPPGTGAAEDQQDLPPGNDEARARFLRREIELRQQTNQLRTTIDTVLLEAVVAYRELVKAYRDMLGKYDALAASRKKSQDPKFDTAKESGTIAAQLQSILDSMQKNATSEEAFLDSVVGYNTAFAKLERMKGTLFYKGAEKEKSE